VIPASKLNNGAEVKVLLIVMLLQAVAAQPGEGEVPVKFEGDEEVVVEGEEEVFFEEEVDADGLGDVAPIPDYEYNQWLLVFPFLCLALLAWSVTWRKPDPEGPR
jgi:hypothetical protein